MPSAVCGPRPASSCTWTWIAGLPGEDFTGFLASLRAVADLDPHMIQIEPLKVLKGSAMREIASRDDYHFSGFPPYMILRNPWLKFADISRIETIGRLLDLFTATASQVKKRSSRCASGQMGLQGARPGKNRVAANVVTTAILSPAPGYWRAIAIRISLSVSVIRSPDRSMVTVCRVPVKRNGAW